MKNLIKNSIDDVSKMNKKERMIKLCELCVKQELGTILPHELIQLEFIQIIRRENGEIAKVLKNWAENPEVDPRLESKGFVEINPLQLKGRINDRQKQHAKERKKLNKKPQPKIEYHKGFFTVNGEIRKKD